MNPFELGKPWESMTIGDQLDACDRQGAWIPGKIVQRKENLIRVGFEKFELKWDETYDISSEKLAPFATMSTPLPSRV